MTLLIQHSTSTKSSTKKMSKPSTKVLIDGVKPVRHNWQIRVKVLHSWKQTTAFAGNTLEFILADETVHSVYSLFFKTLFLFVI